ncbi:hypothetical protein G6F45_001177 [Rhizopus arrhizus]|uniref:Uncharacterized protein n=2 Tax=Rhizopus TaxID=4842 RepID=A0A9P6ZC86_9FUNG|nr:hypothetical protein G6F51_001492 [Rhizopus arrhizus]KAG1574884.1 hypothetical protein G6F50_001583 [Rhizopus delemar]KAG1636590.1 hypothetical protein G6F45_001177 [Rhizopus arrhizus]
MQKLDQTNIQLKMTLEEEESMQSSTTSPELSIYNDVTPRIISDDSLLTKKRRKRRFIKTKPFDEVHHELNEIIHRTIDDTNKEEDETLLSHLIQHAERLKSLSIELLGTEGKIREFRTLESSVLEHYQLREKAYKQRIEECELVSQQQLELIENLVELCNELEPAKKRRSFMTTTTWQSSNRSHCSGSTCATSIHSFHINKQQQRHETNFRYKLSAWIGGSVGTGEIIHSFDNQAGIKEFIIAGSGIIFAIQYNYIFHVNQHVRDKFKLLPKSMWTPDEQKASLQKMW